MQCREEEEEDDVEELTEALVQLHPLTFQGYLAAGIRCADQTHSEATEKGLRTRHLEQSGDETIASLSYA